MIFRNFITILVSSFNILQASAQVSEELHKIKLEPLRRRALEAGVQTFKCTVPGTFAVTFDDGPYKYTSRLLSILRSLNAKATFFVIGGMVDDDQYGPILNRIQREGHQIASHTYSHPHLNELKDDEIYDEITKTNNAIRKRIGKTVDYIRCPYGECDDRVLSIMKETGNKVIKWSLDTNDWMGKSSKEIVDVYNTNVKRNFRNTPGEISLQHDIHPNTIDAVSRLIRVVRSRGYRLTTVAECLGERV